MLLPPIRTAPTAVSGVKLCIVNNAKNDQDWYPASVSPLQRLPVKKLVWNMQGVLQIGGYCGRRVSRARVSM